MATVVMILAPEGFQDQEYGDPRAVLEAAGHKVRTASTAREAVGKFGLHVAVDLLLDEVKPEEFDAIVFVGGPGTPVYFEDASAHQLAHAFYDQGKLTTAICAAPGILAHAGLLKGKKATSWPGVTELIQSKGGQPTDQPVEEDGLLITADGPSSAKAFGERIAARL